MDFHVSDYYDEVTQRVKGTYLKGPIKENRFQTDSGDEMGKRLGRAAGDQSWESGDWEQQTRAVTLIPADSQHREGRWASSEHWSHSMVHC